MIAIIDYGVGNLFSLSSSLKAIGAETVITDDATTIKKADKLILPGVGAFCDAKEKLKSSGLEDVILDEVKNGKLIMGICLGMQMLFEKSYEFGTYTGLGLLKGEIVPIKDAVDSSLKIPHIGWNALSLCRKNPLFKYIKDGDFVYFVHSFYAKNCEDSLLATTEYGIPLTAAVAKNNIYGCQFHPEKSGNIGLNILKGFVDL